MPGRSPIQRPRHPVLGAIRAVALVAGLGGVAAGLDAELDWSGAVWGARPGGAAFPQETRASLPYDGRFTFTRIRYRGHGGRRGWGRSAWSHDYPSADLNLQTILSEFTAIQASTDGSNVFDLEDPEIFHHPILYISEPGYWAITEEGAAHLRDYLLKGGFLIFDDFEGRQWDNMAAQVARALPGYGWVEIDASHPVFSSFFQVEDIYVPHPLVPVTPAYYAIFEDNDPARRIMVLANHNSDLAEYWEWSPSGYFPVDPTNDAYRLGVNYVVYGLTH